MHFTCSFELLSTGLAAYVWIGFCIFVPTQWCVNLKGHCHGGFAIF